MGYRACKAIESPTRHDIESAPVRVGHQAIELRPFLFRARDPDVHVFAGELPAAALTVLSQLAKLNFGILAVVRRADARI